MGRPNHTTAGNHAGPRCERGLEQYMTPPSAVEALLPVEPLPPRILEPCAGDGAIVRVLEAHGHQVTAFDLVRDGTDFLKVAELPADIGAILTNPPFSLAADFVRHGLTLVPKVIVLERAQFLESEARADLFDSGALARVYVFRHRVPRMHKVGWTGNRASPSMFLAWFVFEREHDGTATLRWLRLPRTSRRRTRSCGQLELPFTSTPPATPITPPDADAHADRE